MSRGAWHKSTPLAEPDAIDCYSMLNAIGHEFGLACKVEVKLEFDFKTVVVRAGTYVDMEHFEVVFQAMHKVPIKRSKPIESVMYATLWDIYQQADSGVSGVKQRPVYKARLLRSRLKK